MEKRSKVADINMVEHKTTDTDDSNEEKKVINLTFIT